MFKENEVYTAVKTGSNHEDIFDQLLDPLHSVDAEGVEVVKSHICTYEI